MNELNEDVNFKLFLNIELLKSLTKTKENSYRCIIDIQNQSKTIIIPFTKNVLFFLNDIDSRTDIQIKFIQETNNKVVGQSTIQLPQGIKYQSEMIVEDQFSFEQTEYTCNGKFKLVAMNMQLLSQEKAEKIQKSSIRTSKQQLTSPRRRNQEQKSWKQLDQEKKNEERQNIKHNTLKKEIDKSVEKILRTEEDGFSQKNKAYSDTGFAEESPSRISERVLVNKSAIYDSSQIKQFTVDDSPSKRMNIRNHQELSCLHFLDTANQSDNLQIEVENLKKVTFTQNNKIQALEIENQELNSLRQTVKDKNKLIKDQQSKILQLIDFQKNFEHEFLKNQNSTKTQIQDLLDNEQKLTQKLVQMNIQTSQLISENKSLKENNQNLNKKQKQSADVENQLKQQIILNEKLKINIIDDSKKYVDKIKYYDSIFEQYCVKIDNQDKNNQELNKANQNLEKQVQYQQEKENKSRLSTIQQVSNIKVQQSDPNENQQLLLSSNLIQQKNKEITELKANSALLLNQIKTLKEEKEKLTIKLKEAQQNIIQLKQFNAKHKNIQHEHDLNIEKLNQSIQFHKQQIQQLQNQLKYKIVQLEDNIVQEDNQKKQIQIDQTLQLKSSQLIEKQNVQINELYQKISQMQKQLDQGQMSLETQQKQNQNLKSIITNMKETKAAYIPLHGDPIDYALSEFLNSVNEPERLIGLILRESEGHYMIANKKVYLKTEKGKVYVKIGGGYIGIEEYLDVQGKDQFDRLNKSSIQLQSPQKRSLSPNKQYGSLVSNFKDS